MQRTRAFLNGAVELEEDAIELSDEALQRIAIHPDRMPEQPGPSLKGPNWSNGRCCNEWMREEVASVPRQWRVRNVC